MRNFVPTNPHGTAFAPKQWFYQKEATCMKSSKMYCHHWYKKHTYQCQAVKYPVSWGAVSGRQWRYVELRAYQSPWYRICTKGMVISKGNFVYGELTNVLPSSVQKTYLPLRGRKISRFMGGSKRPTMEICETSCLPIPMIPRLHKSKGYI